jgi:hypothetical protein
MITKSALLSLALTLLATSACQTDSPVGPATPLPSPELLGDALPPIQAGDSTAADQLARAFSIALQEPAVRQQLLVDFRNSQYAKHALILTAYSQTAGGSIVLAAVSRASGIPTSEIQSLARARGGLVLSMQSVRDRLHWRGSDSLGVHGTALTSSEHLSQGRRANAHLVTGGMRAISLTEPASFAVITLAPREHWLAAPPVSHPQGHSETISTQQEEAVRTLQPRLRGIGAAFDMGMDCDPNGTAIIPPQCEDGSGSGASGVYLPSSFTLNQCHPPGGVSDPSQDVDQNGIVDQCEAELAVAFHPQLQFDQGEGPVCPTQEPYWTTKWQNSWFDGSSVIRIFYALSYHEDCGSPNRECPTDCNGHAGDTEFIIEEVTTAGYPTYDGGHWFLHYATLSAHYGSQVDETATYDGQDLTYANAAPGSNPDIWVALWKHANYRSQSVCDAGAYYFDTCDHPGTRIGLEVASWMNLGSRNHPLIDGIGSRQGYPGFEYYWSDHLFCGWANGCVIGSTPYTELMAYWGF